MEKETKILTVTEINGKLNITQTGYSNIELIGLSELLRTDALTKIYKSKTQEPDTDWILISIKPLKNELVLFKNENEKGGRRYFAGHYTIQEGFWSVQDNEPTHYRILND